MKQGFTYRREPVRLIWLDLETTGLDPLKDLILEVCVIVTEGPEFTELGGFSQVIYWAPDELARMNPHVRAMHEKQGLLAEVAASKVFEPNARRGLLDWLLAEGGNYPLCGATIGFDRSFLREQWPEIEALFHYRSLDVSAFRVLAAAVEVECPPKREVHRALDDLRDSIALAKWAGALISNRK